LYFILNAEDKNKVVQLKNWSNMFDTFSNKKVNFLIPSLDTLSFSSVFYKGSKVDNSLRIKTNDRVKIYNKDYYDQTNSIFKE
jgi:hypothetical protein